MPLHDYECECGYVFEDYVAWNEYTVTCDKCGGKAKRIYTDFHGLQHGAPDWLKGTLEVVDKDGDKVCQDFLKYPTRDNYHRWMNHRGIRPMEEGEGIMRVTDKDRSLRKKRHLRLIKENFKKREAIL